MVNNFYTLKALVREWREDLTGGAVQDAFSQVADELTLAFEGREQDWMLRASVQRPLLFIFRSEGISKKRRNVATLFPDAAGRRVEAARIAERDRMLYLDLEGGFRLQIMLFGARANVFLVDDRGTIVDAFRSSDTHIGEPAPEPRAAPQPADFAAFEDRWRSDRNRTDQAISAAFPIFDRTLSTEVMHRAGVSTPAPGDCTEAELRKLFEAADALRDELEHPAPHIYWQEQWAEAFSLVPLHHRAERDEREETFDTVDRAVRVFVRRRLAQQHFRRLYEPLEEALENAADHYRRSAERMLEELTSTSRADRYERWGHLLMAAPQDVPAGAEEVALPDLFDEHNEKVTIPLEPDQDAIANAERYYEKARRVRASREQAETRLLDTQATADDAEQLLSELRGIEQLSALKTFRKREADQLARFTGEKDEEIERVPFRRFPLADGYEVWVSRNAKQNDELTFHHAQKYDLWMHARGVPGSHAVLRLPNRDAEPGKRLLHQAAAIAAYYSKARGHGVAPVMVTRRKYVTSPSGAPPGAVRVEREDVLMVEPRLPG